MAAAGPSMDNITEVEDSRNRTVMTAFLPVCFDNSLVISQGIFLGDNPLRFSVPTLLLELSIIYLSTRAVHYCLQRLGQPRVVSEIITGIILGPPIMGQSETIRNLFPIADAFILEGMAILSLVLFLFTIGVKTELAILKKPGKRAVAITVTGSLTSFLLSTAVFFACRKSFPPDLQTGLLVFYLAERMAFSSFPVLSHALDELGLLNSNLGRTVMSGALVADLSSWVLNAAATSAKLIVKSNSPLRAMGSVGSLVVFVLFVYYVARPLILKELNKTPTGELVDEWCYLVSVLAALVAALLSETIGYKTTLGPFLMGLVLPGGMPLGVTLTERLEPFTLGMYLPLYFVMAGYQMNFSTMNDYEVVGCIMLIVFVCYIGKLIGTMGAALYCNFSLRDAVTMGLMLNIKGIIEVYFFSSWGKNEVVSTQHFTVLLVSFLIVSAITNPLIKFLYDPNRRFVSSKLRTVQNLKPNHPFRLLLCIHNEEHVTPIIDLLEALHPTSQSPVMLYPLHLTELAGRAAAILRPYKKAKSRTAHPTASDHIVNAFRYFENQHASSAISLSPFIAISPVNTMHNGVCSLAMDKKARLLVLPFHKASDGVREMARGSLQSFNRNVLDYAPCSVAILVDRGGVTCAHTNHLLQRAIMYFIGGADDREALSIAMRMVAGGIALTVVRFRIRGGEDAVDEEDEEVIGDLRMRYGQTEGMVYVEKLLMDAEGTVGVLRDMSEKFDLVIVGRRKGTDSELTKGLSAWSECPELGVVGDMLAATEFGGKVSILVVQQQKVGEQEECKAGAGTSKRCADGRSRLLGCADQG